MRFLCSTTGCLSLVIFCILATETFTSVRGNSQEDDFSEFDDLEHPNAVQFESNDIHPDIPASQSDRSIKEDDEFLDTDDNTSGHLFEGRQGDNVSPDTAAEEDDDGVQIEDGFEETDDDKLSPKKDSKATNESKPKTLKITNIPFHLRNNWQSYYIEICLLILLCGYFVNYVVGMSTNRSIADQFLKGNESLLNALFTLVGDTGVMKSGQYIKESEHWYTLWCTGRNGLECAIFELRLIKRQDLISRMMLLFKPQKDELVVKLFLNEEMMDTYVFCLANRGNGLKQMRELNDVQTYCTQRKDRMGLTGDKLLVLSELGDVAAQLFDQQTLYFLNFLNENEDLINYIHISDQFSGPKVVEDTPQTKQPEVKKVMTLSFNLSTANNVDEESNKFLQFTFNLVEKVKRLRLKKELKLKAQKNRQKVEEIYQRAAHALRQEQAQQKREEKLRQEKEKILQENDPHKLRKLEEKEYKRELKRRAPKVKQFKLK